MPDCSRFIEAQADVYETALAELRDGRKRTHWMWFVLPQISGLGASEMARRYAIADRAEAEAHLADPTLGPRLRACVDAILSHRERSARSILGAPDDAKFRSCLTLFAAVAKDGAPDRALFDEALSTFFPEGPDPETIKRL